MKDADYEFKMSDRGSKIVSMNELHDLENNSYISYSGGKDSKVASVLIDKFLPNNKIPRVYFNTGIEYKAMLDHVREEQKTDPRIIIINSGVNIKKMLTENGYPFKSKQHSHNWELYHNNHDEVDRYTEYLNNNKNLIYDYNYIHNLPNGVKTSIKYIFGIREKNVENETRTSVVEREREHYNIIYEYAD